MTAVVTTIIIALYEQFDQINSFDTIRCRSATTREYADLVRLYGWNRHRFLEKASPSAFNAVTYSPRPDASLLLSAQLSSLTPSTRSAAPNISAGDEPRAYLKVLHLLAGPPGPTSPHSASKAPISKNPLDCFLAGNANGSTWR